MKSISHVRLAPLALAPGLLVLGLAVVLGGCADGRSGSDVLGTAPASLPLPALDLSAPSTFETASFALG